jgi:hypothetical protein
MTTDCQGHADYTSQTSEIIGQLCNLFKSSKILTPYFTVLKLKIVYFTSVAILTKY